MLTYLQRDWYHTSLSISFPVNEIMQLLMSLKYFEWMQKVNMRDAWIVLFLTMIFHIKLLGRRTEDYHGQHILLGDFWLLIPQWYWYFTWLSFAYWTRVLVIQALVIHGQTLDYSYFSTSYIYSTLSSNDSFPNT